MKLHSELKMALKIIGGVFGAIGLIFVLIFTGSSITLHPEHTPLAIENIRTICKNKRYYNAEFTTVTIPGGIELRCKILVSQ